MTRSQGHPARPWYDLVIETIALRGWTKAELSDRSGVSRTAIDGWQRNPRSPQAKSVNAVADVLGIPRERALRLAGVIADADPAEANRSPPQPEGLREGTKAAIRKDISDPVLAEQVIAYVEGVASGQIRPASESPGGRPREGGQGRRQGRA